MWTTNLPSKPGFYFLKYLTFSADERRTTICFALDRGMFVRLENNKADFLSAFQLPSESEREFEWSEEALDTPTDTDDWKDAVPSSPGFYFVRQRHGNEMGIDVVELLGTPNNIYAYDDHGEVTTPESYRGLLWLHTPIKMPN